MSSTVPGVADVCERAERMHRLCDKDGLELEALAYTRAWSWSMVLFAILWPEYASCSMSGPALPSSQPCHLTCSFDCSCPPSLQQWSDMHSCTRHSSSPPSSTHTAEMRRPSLKTRISYQTIDVYSLRRSRSAASITALTFSVESPVSADFSACLGQLRPWCVRRPHFGGKRAIFKDGICAPCLRYGKCPSTLPQGIPEAETKVLSQRLLHHT